MNGTRTVIPAQAGIQPGKVCDCLWLDPRLRGDDNELLADNLHTCGKYMDAIKKC
jgi:hypothetical protein